MVAALLFGIFLICLVFSVPIAMSLGVASLGTILIAQPISLDSFAQTMTGLLSSPRSSSVHLRR